MNFDKFLKVGVFFVLAVAISLTMSSVSEAVPESVSISAGGFAIGNNQYSLVNGQPTAIGSFGPNKVGAYPEGSCIPVNAVVSSKNSGDISFYVNYDYHKNGNVTDAIGIENIEQITTALAGDPQTLADNLNNFTFTTNGFSVANVFNSSVGLIPAVINGPYSGSGDGVDPITTSDNQRHYNVTLGNVPAHTDVYVLFCGRLGSDASEFPGASLSMSASKNGGNGGGNISIDATTLLQLPSLTLTKTVVGGTATPDQWSFNVSPAINGVTNFPIAAGSSTVVIPNIPLDGLYTITESSGPADYHFTSGSGVNCGFNSATATAQVAAAKPAANASCVFTNTYTPPIIPPQLVVQNIVVNDDGGLKTVADFSLFVDGNNVTSGATTTVSVGTHTVSELVDPGYIGTFGGDCDNNGSVILAAGDVKVCTLTNDDKAVITTTTTSTPTIGTLIVKTLVINDDGHINTPADFTVTVGGVNLSTSSFAGSADGVPVVMDAGDFNVSQSTSSRYLTTLDANCSGTIAADETKICTITNDDLLLLISNEALKVVNDSEVIITWDTNFDATSRVVYGAASVTQPNPDSENYGYTTSTAEDANFVYHHTVVISGLTSDTNYYFRPISHGSPEVLGSELALIPGGAGPSGGTGGGTSGGTAIPVNMNPVQVAPQAVLGEKITDQTDPAALGTEAPKAVLGYKTLPQTGTDAVDHSGIYYLLSVLFCASGIIIVKKIQL